MTAVSVLDLPGFEQARAYIAERLAGRATPEEAPPVWPPANIERTDPSWFARSLEGEIAPLPPAIQALPPVLRERAAAACGLTPLPARTLPEPLCLACARFCWSHLVDLPDEHDGEIDDSFSATDVPRFPVARLTMAINELGAVELGGLLRRVPDRAAAAVCSLLPEVLRYRVWTVRSAEGGTTPNREQLAMLPELLQTREPGELIFTLGGRILGGWLRVGAPVSAVQAAQLLPVPAARRLLAGAARSVTPISRIITAFSTTSGPG